MMILVAIPLLLTVAGTHQYMYIKQLRSQSDEKQLQIDSIFPFTDNVAYSKWK